MGAGFTDHGLVFCRPDGGPLHPERFSRTFSREAAHAGLPAIRLHDLRHTWATLALSAGEHPKIVQERLDTRTCRSLWMSTPTSARACIVAPRPASQTSFWHRLRKHSRAMVSKQVGKRSGPCAASLTNKGKHCAGEGSRTPMSFRTDGFEPSAYTIPPPRPRANDQPARRTPASPIILPQPSHEQSIKCPLAVTRIWLECPRDCRSQPDQRRFQGPSGRRRGRGVDPLGSSGDAHRGGL
jgi:hypothetical protein